VDEREPSFEEKEADDMSKRESREDWFEKHPNYTRHWARGKFLPGEKTRIRGPAKTWWSKIAQDRVGVKGVIIGRTRRPVGWSGNRYVIQYPDGKKVILASCYLG